MYGYIKCSLISDFNETYVDSNSINGEVAFVKMSLMFSLKDKKGFRIKKSNNLLRFMHSHISQSQKAFLLIATLFHLYIIDKMDKVRKVKWDRYACHLELCVIYGALSLSCS